MGDRLKNAGERYGIAEYQIVALERLLQRTSVVGKRILEVGGSNLPRSLVVDVLGAKEWVAVDNINEGAYQMKRQEMHYDAEGINDLQSAANLIGTQPYLIFNGKIENTQDFPPNYFDLVVSVCSFEHILAMPSALASIRRLKTNEGRLFSYHGPIWSSFCGHHIWVDQIINFNNPNAIVLHGHLLYSPPEMFKILLTKYNHNSAEQAIMQMYHLTRINRLFYEDYLTYLIIAGYGEIEIVPYGETDISDGLQGRLEVRHPGYRVFDAYGMIIFAK